MSCVYCSCVHATLLWRTNSRVFSSICRYTRSSQVQRRLIPAKANKRETIRSQHILIGCSMVLNKPLKQTLVVVSFANPRHPRRCVCGYEDPTRANFHLACRVEVNARTQPFADSNTIDVYSKCRFFLLDPTLPVSGVKSISSLLMTIGK